MDIDKNLMMSDQQSLVGANGVYYSEKSIAVRTAQAIPQLGTGTGGPHDMGLGTCQELVVQVTDDVDSAGGTATVKAELVHATTEDLLTGAVILQSTQAIAEATLVKGYQFRFGDLPPGLTLGFFGIKFTTAGEALTAGKVSAFLTNVRQSTFVG